MRWRRVSLWNYGMYRIRCLHRTGAVSAERDTSALLASTERQAATERKTDCLVCITKACHPPPRVLVAMTFRPLQIIEGGWAGLYTGYGQSYNTTPVFVIRLFPPHIYATSLYSCDSGAIVWGLHGKPGFLLILLKCVSKTCIYLSVTLIAVGTKKNILRIDKFSISQDCHRLLFVSLIVFVLAWTSLCNLSSLDQDMRWKHGEPSMASGSTLHLNA